MLSIEGLIKISFCSKGEWIMGTYWENAVKEFFKKQEQERNKRAASKS
ncbi:hypothetical protein BACCIP111899_02671 [Bacillus rhizoplanae]|uniref:Uncharacterized protein n=1 Tax=Bacillus rhizoplanae TaxID=2880966 RepID=A0ABM8YCM0_9BACI|nr:hypothetical protein [Bacillus rhizoplanae]CAG9613456.1 hypothetical protein BACCIP111899_02671 [Bacillus rhizoplanae]